MNRETTLAIVLSALVGALVIYFSFTPITPQPGESRWVPRLDQVNRIEKMIVMPKGARPLADYSRHYWGENVNGVKTVRGVFISYLTRGVFVSSRAPQTSLDGGCSKVWIWYEPITNKQYARCDGVA